MQEGSDGYSSGFGVIAEPHITVTALDAKDTFVVLSSDGLFSNEERGGGGWGRGEGWVGLGGWVGEFGGWRASKWSRAYAWIMREV